MSSGDVGVEACACSGVALSFVPQKSVGSEVTVISEESRLRMRVRDTLKSDWSSG